MKTTIQACAVLAAIAFSMAAYAAGKDIVDTKNTNAQPPKDTTTYPCWSMMQNGHMQYMYGMMNGNVQAPPAGTKAYTCWDSTQNGHMMRMRNTQMMWNGTQDQSGEKK